MEVLNYQSFGKTDKGVVRELNEDAFNLNQEAGIYVVADGLGGLPHGDLASQTAVKAIESLLLELDSNVELDFQGLYDQVRDEVYKVSEDIHCDFGIATTLTAAKILGTHMSIGHVGDSGVFVFKPDGKMRQLTSDHTMAQDMRDAAPDGESLKIPDYYNHILTQCIGQVKDMKVQQVEYEIEKGDRLLLYTDGVTKTFEVDELQELVFRYKDPKDLVNELIDGANERGGPDNTTAIAVFVS